MTHHKTGLLGLAVIGMLAMTTSGNAADTGAAQSGWDAQQWKQDLMDARERRAEVFRTSRTTALAGIDHFRYEGPNPLYVHVSEAGLSYNDVRTADSKVVFIPDGEDWQWEILDPDTTAIRAGKPAKSGKLIRDTLIDLDRFAIQVWKDNEGRLEFGAFDGERDALKQYKGLYHYEPDSDYRIEADFERFEEVNTVMVLTNMEGVRPFLKYGTVRFNLDGKQVKLTAYKGDATDKSLYIPFRDSTAGKTTYGAGRSMNAMETDGDTIVVDLNGARNFPCAYAPEFHCPIPPQENWLSVAVEAGELTYPLPK